jgi:hypothetical protein
MSYDLYLFKPRVGIDPLETIEELFSEESDEINPGLPNLEKESRKRSIANALINLNPQLEIFPFGFRELAEMEGISEDEAKIKFRHLELNGADDGNGIQITLYDDAADVTVPYWHSGAEAEKVFNEIWSYLKIIESESGFVAYDPQLEKILNLSTDLPEVMEIYKTAV